jgi:hypothetical protein
MVDLRHPLAVRITRMTRNEIESALAHRYRKQGMGVRS